jgi:hypothetical protein
MSRVYRDVLLNQKGRSLRLGGLNVDCYRRLLYPYDRGDHCCRGSAPRPLSCSTICRLLIDALRFVISTATPVAHGFGQLLGAGQADRVGGASRCDQCAEEDSPSTGPSPIAHCCQRIRR